MAKWLGCTLPGSTFALGHEKRGRSPAPGRAAVGYLQLANVPFVYVWSEAKAHEFVMYLLHARFDHPNHAGQHAAPAGLPLPGPIFHLDPRRAMFRSTALCAYHGLGRHALAWPRSLGTEALRPV